MNRLSNDEFAALWPQVAISNNGYDKMTVAGELDTAHLLMNQPEPKKCGNGFVAEE